MGYGLGTGIGDAWRFMLSMAAIPSRGLVAGQAIGNELRKARPLTVALRCQRHNIPLGAPLLDSRKAAFGSSLSRPEETAPWAKPRKSSQPRLLPHSSMTAGISGRARCIEARPGLRQELEGRFGAAVAPWADARPLSHPRAARAR